MPRAKLVRKVMDGGRAWVWVGIGIVNPAESARVSYRGKTALSKMAGSSRLNGDKEAELTHTEKTWLDENREVGT